MRWLSIAIAALSIGGCVGYREPEVHTTHSGLEFPSPVWTTDGLYLVGVPGPGTLFVAPPPMSWQRYTGVLLGEIRAHSKPGRRALSRWVERRIAAICRKALSDEFADAGLRIVEDPGVDVLRLRLSLRDVEIHGIHLPAGSSAVFNPGGGLKITLELRDSLEQRRLLLFGEERSLPFGVYYGPGKVELERLEDAFDSFMADFRQHLDAAVLGELPSPKAPLSTSRYP